MNNLPQLHLKSLFLPILALGLMTTFSGCGNQEKSAEPETQTTAPPSITGSGATQTQVIQLTNAQAEELNINTYKINRSHFSFIITAPSRVHPAPRHISIVAAPVNGRVTNIFAHEGDHVKAGEVLFEFESLEIANLAADYLESNAEANYLKQQVDRLRQLVEKNISPQRALDRAQADLTRANARVRAAISRLQAIGISLQQMQQWENGSGTDKPLLRVRSPINGVINQHLVELGQAVNAYDKILDIIDNSQVMVKGYVSPEDAALLRPGDSLAISTRQVQEASGKSIRATITSINPALDEENKSIMVNAIINTENGWPVIGQNVRSEYSARTQLPVISVPLSAVQYEGDKATVFVKQSPTDYEKRFIDINRITPNAVIVKSGLNVGEEVAVSQVFSLKALGKYEEFAD